MSTLVISGLGSRLELNCTEFTAPIDSTVTAAQTRAMKRYFPIKVNQPEATFVVQFRGEAEYEQFQRFVRRSQIDALNTGSLLNLWWPERDIVNWSGVIKEFRAGGARRNFAPVAQFTVSLITSMVARQTGISSIAASIMTVSGWPDNLLALPSAAENLLDQMLFGLTLQEQSVLNAQFTGQAPVSPMAAITNGRLGIPWLARLGG